MSAKNVSWLLVVGTVIAIILAGVAFAQQQQAANNEATAIANARAALAAQQTSEVNAALAEAAQGTAVAQASEAAQAQAEAESSEATAVARAQAAAAAQAKAESSEATAIVQASEAAEAQAEAESAQATAQAEASAAAEAQTEAEQAQKQAESTRDSALAAQAQAVTAVAQMATKQAQATPLVVIITATLAPEVVVIEPTLAVEPAIAVPVGCDYYIVQAGDTPFAIAAQYGVSGFDLLKVNGLTEETIMSLQIGDVLIIPIAGCPLLDTSPPPTLTNAQVEIAEVVAAGDIKAEGVTIRNTGSTINVQGWTLSDSQGNTYTFPEMRLFSNAEITVFSRVGQNTPVALFWGRSAALFEPGDTLTLRAADGAVQSVFVLP